MRYQVAIKNADSYGERCEKLVLIKKHPNSPDEGIDSLDDVFDALDVERDNIYLSHEVMLNELKNGKYK